MENIAVLIKNWLLNPTVESLAGALAGLLIVVALVGFFKKHLSRYIADPDSRYRARKFVSFLAYFLYIIVLLIVFSSRLSGLTVAFGVVGAGIAFALQEVIASVAGWIAISLGNFYKTGDRIQLGGITGDVIDIGILRTTLMECRQWVSSDLYNGRIVRVANSFVFKEPVFNYSGDFPFLWDEITVPVKHGCDYRLAREIFKRTADEVAGEFVPYARESWSEMVRTYRIEDAAIEPAVTLIVNDNWLEFTIRYAVDYKKRRATKDLLFTRILEDIEKTNGGVQIASTTVNITGVPTVDVRLRQG